MKSYRRYIMIVYLLAYAINCGAQNKNMLSKKARITVTFNTAQPNDTVTLILWTNYISHKKRYFIPIKKYKTTIENNSFSFEVDSLKETVYFEISRGKYLSARSDLLGRQLCSPGDDVNICISDISNSGRKSTTMWGNTECSDCLSFDFKGIGSDKYRILSEIEKERRLLYKKYQKTSGPNPGIFETINSVFNLEVNHVLPHELNTLKKYQDRLPADVYNLIKADIIATHGIVLFTTLLRRYDYVKDSLSIEEKKALMAIYSSRMQQFKLLLDIPVNIMVRSARYSEMLMYEADIEDTFFYHHNSYDQLKNQYEGLLREKLLTNYLINHSNGSRADSLMKDALKIVKFKPYSTLLASLLKAQQLGALAYNFALQDSSGKIVKLSDFKGKVVFIDFWFTGCTGCSEYFQHSVSKAENIFKDNKDVVFITISIDTNKQMWLKALRSGQYTSAHAVNLNTNGIGINHPIIKQLYVITYPHPLLIGKNGQILNNDVSELQDKGAAGLINAINKVLTK